MVGFPGPPAAPDVHVSAHRALTCLARWSAVDCCRFWGPWCRDGAAAVAIAGYRDVGCAGERGPVVGEPPPLVAEATAEFLHGQLGLARVLGAYPTQQPFPCERVDRAERRLGHAVPEVVRPARQ